MTNEADRAHTQDGLTQEDRDWLQANLTLAGVCPPVPAPPEAMKHPWTPIWSPNGAGVRCLFCDDSEYHLRHVADPGT